MPTIPRKTHTRINTRACRSARASKPVYCKTSLRLQKCTKIQNTLWRNTNLKEKKVRHRRIRKPKTTLWKKGNVHPHLLKSAAVPTTRGQRYAKSSCQKPINKYNNNWQIKWKLGPRMNAELDWFKLQRTTKHI